MAPTIYEADGIILNSVDHGESDLIITLYCRDIGRITAIAKGGRRSKKRFVNKLELFSFLHTTLHRSNPRSMALLAEAELHTSFLNLRTDVTRYTAASVLRELVLFGVKEGERDSNLFALILWGMHKLDQGHPHLQVVFHFLIHYLDYIGYRPELQCCIKCGVEIDGVQDYGFNIHEGGLVCARCSSAISSTLLPISPGSIKMMLASQATPLKRLERLKLSGKGLYQTLDLLHRYTRQILNRDIISWKMLRKVV